MFDCRWVIPHPYNFYDMGMSEHGWLRSSSDPHPDTPFWPSFWHTIWTCVYIYIWHICNIYIIIYRYSDVPADILSGISDILSDVLSMSSWAIWRRNPLHQLAVEDEKEEEEVEEKELHLSEKYITDPHLAGELPEGSPTSQLLRYGIVWE